MEKEFITYEQAFALKELGFINGIFAFYDSESKELCYDIEDFYIEPILTPLIQQAFRFFREKYELSYSIIHKQSGQIFEAVVYSLYDPTINHIDGFKTYEEAEQSCLDKLIELTKKSK